MVKRKQTNIVQFCIGQKNLPIGEDKKMFPFLLTLADIFTLLLYFYFSASNKVILLFETLIMI